MKELLVEEKDNILNIYFLNNDILIETYEENLSEPMVEDNIYIGKVQNVFKGMQAAFVNIGINKNVFIHLRDLLPKKEVMNNPNVIVGKDITDYVRPGKPVIVQVMKDANNKKGAKVTGHISIKGRYVIYMPEAGYISASNKLGEEDKNRLKNIVSEILPENDGIIIRTSAKKATKEVLQKEVKDLIGKWNLIKNKDVTKFPELIYNAGGILGKYLIDIIDKDLDKIIVNNETVKELVQTNLNKLNSNMKIEIDENLLERDGLSKQLRKAKNRKIWLDCGGFITIDKTEALTAIDVNSGKYMGKKDFEETVLEINKEATIEIAKQLRLRDIGGIIIIDYIDMHNEENRKNIIELLESETQKDISKVQIEGFSKLNLLELTRKHMYSK